MKYAFIDQHRGRFSVEKMASRLKVCVSSYYDYKNYKHLKRDVNKMVLSEKIRYHFNECYQFYGSRQLSDELRSHGIRASHSTVAKYMHQMGLRSKFYRKFRHTTDSKHNNSIAEDLLDQEFKVDAPNKICVSDITYISVVVGFEYLTTMIDLFDRKVVGYSQSTTLKTKNSVIPALNIPLRWRCSIHLC